jgi:hypothetical protein
LRALLYVHRHRLTSTAKLPGPEHPSEV